MLSKEETFKQLDLFFDSCIRFWIREFTPHLRREGYSTRALALLDVQKLKHDPYSPSGKLLDLEAKEEWLTLNK